MLYAEKKEKKIRPPAVEKTSSGAYLSRCVGPANPWPEEYEVELSYLACRSGFEELSRGFQGQTSGDTDTITPDWSVRELQSRRALYRSQGA